MNYGAIEKWFNARGASKGMRRGRVLAMKKFVKFTRIFHTDENIYVRASCCAEMKRTQEYRVKIVIKTGRSCEILQCTCSCPAGSGWSAACKHLGAVSFSLEYFSITGTYVYKAYLVEFFSIISNFRNSTRIHFMYIKSNGMEQTFNERKRCGHNVNFSNCEEVQRSL